MNISTQSRPMHKLLTFLARLEQAHLAYRLEHIRDSIMVEVAVPGERWEVEYFEDGHIEIERFISSGEISNDEGLLDFLMNNY